MVSNLVSLLRLLPKYHQVLLGLLLIVLLVIIMMPSDKANASRHSGGAEVSQASTTTTDTSSLDSKQVDQAAANSDPAYKIADETRHQVKQGETLAAIFHNANFTPQDVHAVSQLKKAGKAATHLLPGDELKLQKNAQGEFVGLQLKMNPIKTLVIKKTEQGLIEKLDIKPVTYQEKIITTDIKNNFWNAAIDAGLTPGQIMSLAGIFSWDIDFSQNIREGDSFSLIFEEKYADGKFLENGHILAAEFTNQNERFTAVRYQDGKYYSEDGRSMRKAFLKSPVDFKYVSSNFNPRRLHPVTGQVKAHRGVDYVAPIGTPIKAAGDGRVIAATYNKYNGNFVFIKHNDTYTTKYLHLTKRKVKTGQYVKQGDIIGTLGKTGRVTGAHLHYEFIVNGVHRNPRTIKLPEATPIAKSEQANFNQISQHLMSKLTHPNEQYASME